MRRRVVIVAWLSCAVLGEACVGFLWPADVRPPLLAFAVVAGVALSVGTRVGVVAGFGTGVALDLLSGPASLAGVYTLTALIVGSASGALARRRRDAPSGSAAVAGALAVSTAAVVAVTLHRLFGYAIADVVSGVIGQGLALGAVVTPLVRHALARSSVRPLLPTTLDV